MQHNDVLVEAILNAISQQPYTAEEKRVAVVRAGAIARVYEFRADLLFKQDCNVNNRLDNASDSAATQ
jgi:hypothetical protein